MKVSTRTAPGAALPPGGREGLADGGLVRQVDHHPPAVVAVERLQHGRVAEAAGGGDRLLPPADHRRAGDGDADLVQHPVGQLLVAGHLDGGVAVSLVTVAQIRFWWPPWPSWTSERRGSSRSTGISRRSASATMAPVEGP
jgi:hypothetical protein